MVHESLTGAIRSMPREVLDSLGATSCRGRIARPLVAVVLVTLAAAIVLTGCQTTEQMAPPVGPALQSMADRKDIDTAALEHGRRIYLTACARCHSVEPIDRYSEQKWTSILPDMTARSKLNPQQTSDLREYLFAARRTMTAPDHPGTAQAR